MQQHKIESGSGDHVKLAVAGARSTWPFGGDHITQVTAAMSEDEREALRWLFYHSLENGISMADAAKAIHYDVTTVYRVFKGDYAAKLDGIVESVESYQRIAMERQGIKAATFVETPTVKKIWQLLDAVVAYSSIGFLYGASQIGKTWALEEYARRHNHGSTKYVRLASSSGVQLLMKLFAEECGFSPRGAFDALRKRVFKALDSNVLVIVDELHLAFFTYHKTARLAVLELLREMHDRCRCPMILCGSKVADDEIERGPQKDYLEQLRRRGVFRVILPDYPSKSDVRAIARSFGLDTPDGPAAELVTEVLRRSGLKAFTSYLQAATKLASNRKAALAWGHFIEAHDVIARLSKP